jgi:uncharacterized protein YceK
MRSLITLLIIMALSGCGSSTVATAPHETGRRLEIGMSYAEVVKLLGEPAFDMGDSVLRPVWIEKDGRWFTPAFNGDKLASIPGPTTAAWQAR